MKLNFLENPTLEAMESYMSRMSRRQQIVAANVANIDTPGYKAQDVAFQASMEHLMSQNSVELKVTQPGHIPPNELNSAPLEAEVFETPGLQGRADGNNVDLDQEMLKLGETSFAYSMTTQLLRSKFRTIASSINEGRTGA